MATEPAADPMYSPMDAIEVRASHLGGLGIFALKTFEVGDVVLTEKPLLHTTPGDLIEDFHQLPQPAKDKYMRLSRTPVFPWMGEIEQIRRANA